MEYRLTISGTLPGLNEYTNANRTNPFKGNKMKKDAQELIIWHIRQQLKGVHINKPIMLKYDFYEPNKKRDLDNISAFAHKTVQDSLVKAEILTNDGWNEIVGMLDQFYCDKDNPRIEVTLVEV